MESGYTCTAELGETSACSPIDDDATCGDGEREAAEQCDEGDENSDNPNASCRTDCTERACGDGIKDDAFGEQCDDGNREDGDGCSASCQTEFCGDGFEDTDGPDNVAGNDDDEECDLGDDNSDTPNAECRTDCTEQRCGDRITDGQEGEECDDGNRSNFDTCTNKCKEAACGDGIRQPNGADGIPNTDDDEECDDGNGDNGDTCTNACTAAECGDGYEQPKGPDGIAGNANDEECDDGNKVSGDGCSASCREEEDDDDGDGGGTGGTGGSQGGQGGNQGGNVGGSVGGDVGGDVGGQGGNVGGNIGGDTGGQGGNVGGQGGSQGGQGGNQGGSQGGGGDDDDGDRGRPDDARGVLEELRDQADEISEGASGEGSAGTEGTDGSEDAREEAEEERPKPSDRQQGCFNRDGEWITGAPVECDPNQRRHARGQRIATAEGDELVVPSVPEREPSEPQARRQIAERLAGPDYNKRKTAQFRRALEDARERLVLLREGYDFPDAADGYFRRSIEWLDQAIAYFLQPRSVREIRMMREPLAKVLNQAQAFAAEVVPEPGDRPSIRPLLDRTDRLLGKFRRGFMALIRNAVPVDQNALTAYMQAANTFDEIRAACAERGERCRDLEEVLTLLRQAEDPLREALSERPELLEQVEARVE